MKLRSFFYGLIAVVITLLTIGGIGFYWITAQSPLKLLASSPGKAPSAAIFVPKQAPAMLSLLVNPDDLESFRQVVAMPDKRRQARAELAQFKQSLLANTGLEYERDVQPWLGDEITLAITTLDIDRDSTNGKQPGYLLAMATKEPERSREFLQLFWQKRAIAGTDLTFEQYKGVKLIYNEVPVVTKPENKNKKEKGNSLPELFSLLPVPSLASAVVGDQFVLFANHPKVLRDAITNVQANELNLDHARFYTKALENLDQPRIGLTFVNLPRLSTWLERESITPSVETSRQGKAQKAADTIKPDQFNNAKDSIGNQDTEQYETMVLALELNRKGLMTEIAMIDQNGTGNSVIPTLVKPVDALRYIPANSPLSASGTDLDRLWNGLTSSLSSYGTVAQIVNQPLNDLEKQWKLDLSEDVFSWVKGDYALAILPSQSNRADTKAVNRRKKSRSALDALPDNDWVFVAQRANSDAAKQAIAHLDEIAKQQGYSVGALTLGDRPISAWTRLKPNTMFSKTLQAEVQGVHATVDNYEIFTTSIVAMEAALNAVENSLAKSDHFQQATASLDTPNNGYLYVDWNKSRPILEQQVPLLKVIELAGGPLFNHLQSFTISSYGSKDGVQRSGLFIQLS